MDPHITQAGYALSNLIAAKGVDWTTGALGAGLGSLVTLQGKLWWDAFKAWRGDYKDQVATTTSVLYQDPSLGIYGQAPELPLAKILPNRADQDMVMKAIKNNKNKASIINLPPAARARIVGTLANFVSGNDPIGAVYRRWEAVTGERSPHLGDFIVVLTCEDGKDVVTSKIRLLVESVETFKRLPPKDKLHEVELAVPHQAKRLHTLHEILEHEERKKAAGESGFPVVRLAVSMPQPA